MRKLLLAGAALVAFSGPAFAVTAVTLDREVVNNDALFYTSDVLFNLPTSFTNAMVNIGSFISDDATVLLLNGTPLYGVGIFGNGSTTGQFYFSPNGPASPYVFQANGTQNVSLSGPFTAGSNTISFVTNNNNAGINVNGDPLTVGPSSLSFTGSVTYDLLSAVPEPATWGMMIVGFGVVGGAMRRRNTKVNFATA